VLTKRQKGIVIRFLLQVTGYSRQQLTRLIQQYLNTGVVQLSDTNKPAGFKQTYTTTDIALLAEMDERYDTPSGGVVKKLCERATLEGFLFSYLKWLDAMSECLVFSLRKKTLRENTRPYRYHGLKIFTSFAKVGTPRRSENKKSSLLLRLCFYNFQQLNSYHFATVLAHYPNWSDSCANEEKQTEIPIDHLQK
jgi:hypothetical protein